MSLRRDGQFGYDMSREMETIGEVICLVGHIRLAVVTKEGDMKELGLTRRKHLVIEKERGFVPLKTRIAPVSMLASFE